MDGLRDERLLGTDMDEPPLHIRTTSYGAVTLEAILCLFSDFWQVKLDSNMQLKVTETWYQGVFASVHAKEIQSPVFYKLQ